MRSKRVGVQRGFLSIEALGSGFYWLMGMILAFGAVGAVYKLTSSNQEIQNTNQLLQVTRHLKSSRGYKKGSLVSELIKLSMVPNTVTISGNRLYNTHGGEIIIKGNDSRIGYTLETRDIPQDECIKLASNISRGSLVSKTKINSGQEINGEVEPDVAVTLCSEEKNIILFSTRT